MKKIKYKNFFNLRARKFHFLKYKSILYLGPCKSRPPEIKKNRNNIEFFKLGSRKFNFPKHKENFF